MTLAPDLVEPVVVWRVWNVQDAGGRPELVSPVQASPWPSRESTAATCGRCCGRVASASCSCGLYGYHDVLRTEGDWSPGRVLGCAALGGRVVQHLDGYRGQFGYPLVLFVHTLLPDPRLERLIDIVFEDMPERPDLHLPDRRLVRRLADAYAVPVRGVSRPRIAADAVTARSTAAAAVAEEAARGLPARRDGDSRAHDRLDAVVENLAAAWAGSADR